MAELPQIAEFPHMAELPHMAEFPHIALLGMNPSAPQTVLLSHTVGGAPACAFKIAAIPQGVLESVTKYTFPLAVSNVAVGDLAAPVALSLFISAAWISRYPAPTVKMSDCTLKL